MYKIGIIGTENSHAMAFAKLINLPQDGSDLLYKDARVTDVFGPDEASARLILEEAGAESIVARPEDMLKRVDAVMVTSRKGSVHYEYAMPFIEAGMPVFIDKPFTVDSAQAERLIALAKASGSLLCGGSGCKLAEDVICVGRRAVQLRAEGRLCSAAINFALDLNSPYDGFYFYASHLVEMAIAIFGADVKSVFAFERNGTVVSVWRYDDIDVSLHFTKDTSDSTVVLFAQGGNIVKGIDIAGIYGLEVAMFVQMLRSRKMPASYESLVAPVRLMEAMERAMGAGGEVRGL